MKACSRGSSASMRASSSSVSATGLTSPCRIAAARLPIPSNASVSAMFVALLSSVCRGRVAPGNSTPGRGGARRPCPGIGSAIRPCPPDRLGDSPLVNAPARGILPRMHDVIVVGGGVVGATAAYLCARDGLKTLLVDRTDVGRATDAGAGIISPRTSTRHETLFDLGLRSGAYYPTLLAHLEEDGGGDTGHAVCGDLRVAVEDDELKPFADLMAVLDARRALHGRPTLDEVSEISPDEARAVFPASRAPAPRRPRPHRRARRRPPPQPGALRGRRSDGTSTGCAPASTACSSRAVASAGVAAGTDDASGRPRRHRRWRVVTRTRRPGRPDRRRGPAARPDHPHAPGGSAHGDWPVVHGFHDHYIVTWQAAAVSSPAPRARPGPGFDPRVTAGGVHPVLGRGAARGARPRRARPCSRRASASARSPPTGYPCSAAIPGVVRRLRRHRPRPLRPHARPLQRPRDRRPRPRPPRRPRPDHVPRRPIPRERPRPAPAVK